LSPIKLADGHGRVRPCAIVEVVLNKLFPKIRRLCSELLEIRENEPNGNANLEMKDGKKNYFIKDI
ncbi:MAG: hypothetical protein KIH06_05875, partial [Kiritimatiellae bacterium]|nr:hypothetical protein [Kiritimatiellia bacterium]